MAVKRRGEVSRLLRRNPLNKFFSLGSVDLVSFKGRIVDCASASSYQDLLRNHRILLHTRTNEFYKKRQKDPLAELRDACVDMELVKDVKEMEGKKKAELGTIIRDHLFQCGGDPKSFILRPLVLWYSVSMMKSCPRQFVRHLVACKVCQELSSNHLSVFAPYPLASEWQRANIDYAQTKGRLILVMMDADSKWIEAD
ncbi:unnamed protein product [Lepeophtheirus salmonis]|uniref:(salmon louse) hypothetical protein n=1 Tax=Lepeophtheirus salmonis TaxID=72036 RepID=A0A7R8CM47_LEPSM|nr:unnamed protein product [Lepeophtheirus salmonis]CAF2828570.1 unnamed protein product [Lepeophtheirus salmonis]